MSQPEALHLSGPTWMPVERPSLPLRHEAAQVESRRAGRHQQLAVRTIDHLLAAYCPPTLLVNEELEVLHIIGEVSPYLKKLSGIPSFSVLQLLHDDLCLPVQTVLQRLRQAPEDIICHHVLVRMAEGRQYLTIRGHRESTAASSSGVTDSSAVMVLTFEVSARGGHAWPTEQERAVRTLEQERIEALEQRLKHAQETLHAALEELDTQSAALQAGHEAMFVSNEALRMANLKTAETMLQQSEKRFRILIEESAQGILIYRSGRPLFVNRTCAQLFGYASPQAMLELEDLVAAIAAPHEYARLWHYTQRLLEEGTPPMRHEFQGQCQDGSMIWVENAMRCIMWEGACAVQSTLVDITERKRAEEALARKTLELQRSNDDLEQFAYVASHDLQEPLRMVSSYLDLLRDRCAGQLGADAEQFIAFAVDGAGRMQQLIRDLLAYARLGQQALVLKSISSDTLLDAALDTLHFALKDSGAKVTRARLPTVRVDPAQIELLWRNLISNAIKFRGKKRPQVDIHADFRGDAWLFSVRDNGIGIEPKDVERIFTLFQRLHPRDVYTGTGIGLALCKRIVERHGGRIWVASQPGEGATFTFTLPA